MKLYVKNKVIWKADTISHIWFTFSICFHLRVHLSSSSSSSLLLLSLPSLASSARSLYSPSKAWYFSLNLCTFSLWCRFTSFKAWTLALVIQKKYVCVSTESVPHKSDNLHTCLSPPPNPQPQSSCLLFQRGNIIYLSHPSMHGSMIIAYEIEIF